MTLNASFCITHKYTEYPHQFQGFLYDKNILINYLLIT